MMVAKHDPPAARFVIKNREHGTYIKELVAGVSPDWTPSVAEAATYASKAYAKAKVERFALNADVKPVAMRVAR